MFVIGNFISAIAMIANIVLNLFMWIIIARAVLSWVNPDPYNPIVRFIYNVTEPVLQPVRSRVPAFGGLDLSPFLVILAVIFLKSFVIASLLRLAHTLA